MPFFKKTAHNRCSVALCAVLVPILTFSLGANLVTLGADAGGSVRYIPRGAAGRGICDADGRDRCGRISAGGDGGSGGYGAGGGVVSGRAQIVGHKMSFIQHLFIFARTLSYIFPEEA